MTICVGGILFKESKLLLGKRSGERTFYPGVWDIIGGHVEDHETREQALMRELQEELNVRAREVKPLAILTDQEIMIGEQFCLYIYLVTNWIGVPINASPDEHEMLGWFDIHEAVQLDLALPMYAEVFHRLEEGRQTR